MTDASEATQAPASDPLQILLTQNHWATRSLLERCRELSSEQVHQKFEIGPGSLHDTFTHIVGVVRAWTDVLNSREEVRMKLDEQDRSVDELLELLDEFCADLKSVANTHPVEEAVKVNFRGSDWSFIRGGVLTHVTTHGMHHRAQVTNMLRQMGVEEVPDVSVLRWMLSDGA